MQNLYPQPDICFENALALVREEPAGEYMLLEWKEAPWQEQQAHQVCEQVLPCLRQRGWHKLLVNRIALPIFPPAYHTWLLYDWLPRAYRAGLVCYALVLPREIFSRIAFEDLIRQSRRRQVCCLTTDSLAKASEWLLQQPIGDKQALLWPLPGPKSDSERSN